MSDGGPIVIERPQPQYIVSYPTTRPVSHIVSHGVQIPAQTTFGNIFGATPGSVIFAGASGQLAQDNANLFYDDTNNRLGIGTNVPLGPLHVETAGSLFRIGVGAPLLGFGFVDNTLYHRLRSAGASNDNIILQLKDASTHYLSVIGMFNTEFGATIGFSSGTVTPATGTLQVANEVGIARTPVNDAALSIGQPTSTAATTLYGIRFNVTAPAAVTTALYGIYSDMRTAAASFTVTQVVHFGAITTTQGAGSTITNVRGFFANNSITVGVNNYGFYSDFAADTNTYAFYSAGTAENFFNGSVGIRATPGTDRSLYITSPTNSGNSVSMYGIVNAITGTTAATTQVIGIYSALTSATAAYTVTSLIHFDAEVSTLGGGSTVTNVFGFWAKNAIAIGQNNYGFYSTINYPGSGTTYQLWMDGTAESRFDGSVQLVGAGTTQGFCLSIGGTHASSNVTIYGYQADLTYPATATGNLYNFRSVMRSTNAVYTTTQMTHFIAEQIIKGASHTLSTHRGFYASNSIAGAATNTYGFYSDINLATSTFQFYAAGSAYSYFNGPVGIFQVDPLAVDALLAVGSGASNHVDTGTVVRGVSCDYIAPSTATSQAHGFTSLVRTANAGFTINTVVNFFAIQNVKGAASTINSVVGFYASNNIAVGSNNYGFYSDINEATGTWQFHGSGTAPSAMRRLNLIAQSTITDNTASILHVGGIHTSAAVTAQAQSIDMTSPSTMTGTQGGITVTLRSTNAVYTTGTAVYFQANTYVKGASHTLTNIYGFQVGASVGGNATNTYGFRSDLADAANTFAFYAGGTAKSTFNGSVQVANAGTSDTYYIGFTGTHANTATTVYGVSADVTCPATTTANFVMYRSSMRTVNSVFTLTTLIHFNAETVIKGASATITSVYGFQAHNNIAVGTNNYGFYSNINDAATTYQFYGAGTASSYFGGSVGVQGLATIASQVFRAVITTAQSASSPTWVNVGGTLPATATSTPSCVAVSVSTANSVFTTATLTLFSALAVSKGASHTLNIVYGFNAANAIAVGGSNYGFYSDINSAANTFQLYMSGTALNFIKGGVILDTTAAPTVGANQIGLGATTATTVGAAGGASALPATPDGYWIINVAGTAKKVPYYAT